MSLFVDLPWDKLEDWLETNPKKFFGHIGIKVDQDHKAYGDKAIDFEYITRGNI
jgi:hypothetical protein